MNVSNEKPKLLEFNSIELRALSRMSALVENLEILNGKLDMQPLDSQLMKEFGAKRLVRLFGHCPMDNRKNSDSFK